MPIERISSNSYDELIKNRVDNLSKVDTVNTEDEKLMEVCRDFESIFVNMMLQTMRGTVDDENSLIPKSQGTKTFESMRDEELARQMSMEGSGFGLSETLYNQMKASKAYK